MYRTSQPTYLGSAAVWNHNGQVHIHMQFQIISIQFTNTVLIKELHHVIDIQGAPIKNNPLEKNYISGIAADFFMLFT